jgi:2-methylisocitrate lyase-like PEP mutase family enzyme
MVDAKAKRKKFRDMMNSGRLIVAPGAHNGMAAKLIERAGFEAAYMTGSGVSNTLLGEPDVGLLTLSEMTFVARCIAQPVGIPVIADADTGYGNAINVMRTVQEFEAAGVAGIHIEDQISPKRCGHIVGKELISAEEMAGKIRAAVDGRTDPDFVIIARTDARGPVGLGEAIRRANLYAEAGADMLFADALLSEDELAEFARSVPHPKMMNMGGYSATRTTPKLPLPTVQGLGFSLVIFPLAIVRAGVRAEWDFLQGLKERGTEYEIDHIADLKGHPTESWYEFTGIGRIKRLEERYLPQAMVETKYKTGMGHVPSGVVRTK